ncbi:MAG: tetratricopeptide repeat protein [Pseudohongiellaceae bacterium]
MDDLQYEELLSASDALFTFRPQIPKPHEIHALNEEQQANFLQYFHDPVRAGLPDYRRVVSYLRLLTSNFNYRTDTFNAADTITTNSGNCLSLAILTTVLAQLVGVETGYQLMDSEPVFEFHGTLVEKGVHVRTLLLNSKRLAQPANLRESRGIAIDFFPTQRERFIRNMQAGEYVAMYYRNIAIEALGNNDLSKSYRYARESLQYHPRSSAALNTLAIVNRRAGHLETSEAIYRYAIQNADEKLTLLKNYRLLLVSAGRHAEAQLIDAQLQRMDDPSPFNWFHLARSAFEDGDFRRAIDYYNRALALAPYLHEAHAGLARSYFELGYSDRSKQELVAAIENAGRLSDRKYYKAKLASFLSEN